MQHYSIWRVTFLTTGISIYDIRNDCDYSSHTYTRNDCDYSSHTYTEKRRGIMGRKQFIQPSPQH